MDNRFDSFPFFFLLFCVPHRRMPPKNLLKMWKRCLGCRELLSQSVRSPVCFSCATTIAEWYQNLHVDSFHLLMDFLGRESIQN